MRVALRSSDLEQELVEFMADCSRDPLTWVMRAFPWGESGELEQYDGPRAWQRDVLAEIGERLRQGYSAMPILKAIASGHGPGKSALLAWVALWSLSTFEDSRVFVTANTQQQLRTKTWPEISMWHRHLICNDWFTLQGESIVSASATHSRTWRCDAVTWSEHNVEAFQGAHNKGRRLVMLFDEASGIADKVWEVTEGALTDENTEIIWLAMGNPTEPTGRFFECFHRQRHRWSPQHIDSRDVPGTNKALFAEWIRLYGDDHDFVRVRVKGQFPRSGTMQFIPTGLVDEAIEREPLPLLSDPFVIGVDVARFGDDQSVIYFRKGRDGRTHSPLKFRGIDTMQLAGRVAEEAQRYRADAVFVDGGGLGAGVVDRLRQLGVSVVDVQFGGKADRVTMTEEMPAYANKRAEMWGNLREWLKGASIPDDPELRADLVAPQYTFVVKDGRDSIQLERKEDMKARGQASPDTGDALALTFAYPVAPRAHAGGLHARPRLLADHDPFAGFE